MTKRLMMVLFALLLIGAQAFAQSSVSGKVTDEQGEPVVGAGVVIKGTTRGTSADLDGNWTITAKAGDVLVFSAIGYASQEVSLGSQKTVNVTLKNDALFLEDVIVIGYGSAKRKDLTGAITQINNKLLTTQNASSATKALEGAVPGLIYAAVDAQPGNDAGLRVRGLGSTSQNSSDALVVIDGVPAQGANPLSNMNSEDIASITVLKDAASTAIYGSRGANGVILVTTKNGTSGKTKVNFQTRFGWNTPGTYASNQIDNAAGIYEYVWRSIYNSYRYGVNKTGGPVLDAATGEYKTNVNNPNYTHEQAAEFASQHLFNYIGQENTFARNSLGNYMAYNVPGAVYTPDGSNSSSSSTMSGEYLIDPSTGRLNPKAKLLYKDTYADALLQTGFRQQYDIAASGGSEKEDHYISIGFMEDPSYIPNSNFSRLTGRAKINAKLFEWLKVGTNVNYTYSRTNYIGSYWNARNSGSNQGSVSRFVNGHTPIIPFHAHDKDGNFIYDKNGEKLRNVLYNETYSPLGQTTRNYGGTDILYAIKHDVREDVYQILNTRSYAEVYFLNHFTYRLDVSYDFINRMENRYYNGTTGRAKGIGGYFGKRNSNTNVLNLQNRISYIQDFGKHHVDAMALTESSDWEYEHTAWGGTDEFIPGFLANGNFVGRYRSAGSTWTPNYGHDIERMRSYLGRANYVYADKYYLTGSIRRDGSSKFRAANRWGTFWSVGAGWRISEESFLSEAHESWLTNAKLRTSYGLIGNQNGIGRYMTYRTWGYSTIYKSATNGTGIPTGTDYKLSMGGFVNDALTWEETATFDIGLDLSVFDRVDVTLDFYNRVTGNSLFLQPVSLLATGQSKLPRNCAEITNRGIEIDINADIIRTRDFIWNIAFNASHYTTKLTNLPKDAIPAHVEGLPEGTWEANTDSWGNAGAGSQSATCYLRGIGRDWYNMYLHRYMGIDEKTGLPLYLHRVTQADHDAGKFTDTPVGEGVKTTNYALSSKWEVGSAIPDLVGGFNTSLSWKNFSLDMQFAYQLGGKFFSADYAQLLYATTGSQSFGQMFASKEALHNTWTPENKGAGFPMQWYPSGNNTFFQGTSANGQNWHFTDMSLFSASYLRLKNITVSYRAPKEFFKNIGIEYVSGLRLFASADNLFILTAAKGIDPSMTAGGGYGDVDTYCFPMMRTFTLGFNLDF